MLVKDRVQFGKYANWDPDENKWRTIRLVLVIVSACIGAVFVNKLLYQCNVVSVQWAKMQWRAARLQEILADSYPPINPNMVKQLFSGRNQYDINRELLTIQIFAMYNSCLDDKYILTKIINQWSLVIVKSLFV